MNSNIISNLTTETYISNSNKSNATANSYASQSQDAEQSFKSALSKREGGDDQSNKNFIPESNEPKDLPDSYKAEDNVSPNLIDDSLVSSLTHDGNNDTSSISELDTELSDSVITSINDQEEPKAAKSSELPVTDTILSDSSFDHEQAENAELGSSKRITTESILGNKAAIGASSQPDLTTENKASTHSVTETANLTAEKNSSSNIADGGVSVQQANIKFDNVSSEEGVNPDEKIEEKSTRSVKQEGLSSNNHLNTNASNDFALDQQRIDQITNSQSSFSLTSKSYNLSNMISKASQDIARESSNLKDGDKKEIKVTIRPNHLGELKIEISKEAGKTNVSIITSNESVTNYLSLHKTEILAEAEKTLRNMDSNSSGDGEQSESEKQSGNKEQIQFDEVANAAPASVENEYVTGIILNIGSSQA